MCKKKEDDGKVYAVKVFREDDEEKRMVLLKEPLVLKKLNHPNIVKYVDHFDNQLKGEIHMVMEYVNGMEVMDHLASQPDHVYTEETAKEIFKQVLTGLEYLH